MERSVRSATRARHRTLRCGIWERNVRELTDVDFKQMYRLTRAEFDLFYMGLTNACPWYVGKYANRLSGKARLASCLRFLAGGAAIDVRFCHGQSQTGFARDFILTLRAIVKAFPLETKWKEGQSLHQLDLACRAAGTNADAFHGCVGFIDGLIVRCRKPKSWEISLSNVRDFWCERKKTFGLNLQAICDASLRIRYFSCFGGGSTADSTAFRSSKLGRHLTSNEGFNGPYFLLGDAAYRTIPGILTPFSGSHARGSMRDTYNYVASGKRCAIERCFGVLVRRWGILWRSLEFSPPKCNLIMSALVSLHNFLVDNRTRADLEETQQHPSDSSVAPTDSVIARTMIGEHDTDDTSNDGWDTRERLWRLRIAADLQNSGYIRPEAE